MSNLGNGTEYILSNFMGNTKLDVPVYMLPWGAELSFREMLSGCRADKKTSEQKHNSELGTGQSMIEARGWLARKQLCRKGIAVLVDKSVTTSQHCIVVAATADCVWGCN